MRRPRWWLRWSWPARRTRRGRWRAPTSLRGNGADRRRPRRLAGHARVASDFERQAGSVRITDLDGLAIADVDQFLPTVIDEGAIQRVVVDRYPATPIEAQQQMDARRYRVRNAYVSVQVASDDHVVACCEPTLRPVVVDAQHRRRRGVHTSNL